MLHSAWLKKIGVELKKHAPFTAFGALTGVAIMAVIFFAKVPYSISETAFWTLHPLHVLFSALATTAMYRLHGRSGLWRAMAVGYVGSIGIATLSDSLIPFLGEWALGLPNRGIHLGIIEKWWLVSLLAVLGITIGYLRPTTKLPHTSHVLLSTWASLFHMISATDGALSVTIVIPITTFLFFAVWVPCCTSDIVFPLLFVPRERSSIERGRGVSGKPWSVTGF